LTYMNDYALDTELANLSFLLGQSCACAIAGLILLWDFPLGKSI
jgi:hypothetical protein